MHSYLRLYLISGGVLFSELTPEMAYSFQKDLLKTMLTIENTYIHVSNFFYFCFIFLKF
jgi:hypothetical protein